MSGQPSPTCPSPETTRGHVSRRTLRSVAIRCLAVYLLLLAVSHLVRWWRSPADSETAATSLPTFQTAELASGQDGTIDATGRVVRLAWHEWMPSERTDAVPSPVVVLLHGSPGDGSNFDRMGSVLAQRGLGVLAPDLPGFGASSRDVADYSILAHAGYCLALLDHLGVETAHAVGFSMGGGVALHLEALAPTRVESVTLLSAIGVQEMELLGNYTVNHAIHGAQLAALYFLFEGFPHFGVLDSPMLDIPYARNFFDTDQRPLRDLLRSFSDPMLIMHGEEDFLVPFEAAQEHRRLVPHSRLVTFSSLGAPSSHFVLFEEPTKLAVAISSFVREVEMGTAMKRSDASAERLLASESGTPVRLPRASGPTLVVWVLLLAVATLLSEDLTCIAAGLLVAQGSLGFAPAVIGCASGIFLGDLGLYGLGRLGRPWLERFPLRWIVRPRSVRRAELWFGRRGPVVIFLSRFLPGTRIATYVAAGLLGMGFLRFAVSLLVPVMLWVPAIVWISGKLGQRLFVHVQVLEAHSWPIFLGALAGVWILVGFGRSLVTWRGRRGFVGRWIRWTRWEFWPPWLFYPPVIVYIAWLALRHRSATLFTAANPGFEAGGGFVGESKSQILGRLDSCLRGTTVEGAVAEFEIIPPGPLPQRLKSAKTFQARHGWPVVLKPDVGQRGAGVVIARSDEDVEGYFVHAPDSAIIQVYVTGPELGIFWLRLPATDANPAGPPQIFSVTDKRLPEVVGDGKSTLESLILSDPRAVAMAPTYLDQHYDQLENVPAEGESVHLVELGTHCRGAVFLDGRHLTTPQLQTAMDALGDPFQGFSFGRFDLRAPSLDHFRRGEGIRVLEVNGVTSEATHIYDPHTSLLDAYKTLFEQWRLAFEIGRRQRQQGHEPIGLVALSAMAFRFLAKR